MKASTYFFILFLLTVRVFDIQPFGEWFYSYNGLPWIASIFVWMMIGVFLFGKRGNHSLYTKEYRLPILLILLGVFFSFVPAYYFYNQSLFTSLVAYRKVYYWFVAFVILYIGPKPEDIIKPALLFSIVFFIMSMLKTYYFDALFYINKESSEYIRDLGEIVRTEGLELLLFPLYYYGEKMRNSFSWNNMLVVGAILAMFFIIQNRSTLFVSVFIISLMLLTNKSQYRFIYTVIIVALGVFSLYQTAEIWLSLLRETQNQLADTNYNRVKAFNYFIYEGYQNWFVFLFGNGFLSAHSTTHMQDMMGMGVYNTDLGFVGFWNQFGIIPVAVFIIYCVKTLIKKKMPVYVKALALHILLNSLTIAYFLTGVRALWFILFYYLYVYYNNRKRYDKIASKISRTRNN